VLTNGGGGNPGGNVPAKAAESGVGVLVGPGRMPTARSLSRREPGSGNGVDVDGVAEGALMAGWMLGGGERIDVAV
jgi:hypothetical protein